MFILRRQGCHHVTKRCVSTVAVPSEATSVVTSVKSYSEIPRVSTAKALWELTFSERKLKIDQVLADYFAEHGPIVKLVMPGQDDRLLVRDPQAMKTVMEHDGKNPIEPGFDHMVYYRNNIRKELFPETTGVAGSHGEAWYENRSQVQKDMMRPKSAMFYINDIEEVTNDFLELVSDSLDHNDEVDDLLDLVNRWTLESVVAMFLDMRINCLEKHLPDDSDVKKFVNAVKVVTGQEGNDMAYGIPLWKYFSTPTFKRFDKANIEIYDISKNFIDKAIAGMDAADGKSYDEMSVLQKLIRRCGPASQIPHVMSQDGILAGVDTTGTTAAFLLLDLARNPEQQEELWREVRAVVGEHGQVTEAKLNQMKYLKACLHESQRLWPAASGFSRRTQVEMVVEGYEVPRGVVVTYFIMLAARDPAQFPAPSSFLPARWLRGCPAHHSAHPFATVFFSHGANKIFFIHKCLFYTPQDPGRVSGGGSRSWSATCWPSRCCSATAWSTTTATWGSTPSSSTNRTRTSDSSSSQDDKLKLYFSI